MKVAFYIGTGSSDGQFSQFGAWLTCLVQKGPYSFITHVEAIHEEHGDGTVTIASSSFRDGGVRNIRCKLEPTDWIIINVPSWDVKKSIDFLKKTNGAGYDLRGAVATVFLGSQDNNRWFCSEWVGAPFLKAPGTFGPHHLAAIALSLGEDVTVSFFEEQKHF